MTVLQTVFLIRSKEVVSNLKSPFQSEVNQFKPDRYKEILGSWFSTFEPDRSLTVMSFFGKNPLEPVFTIIGHKMATKTIKGHFLH